MAEKPEDDDSHVQMWKVKQLIRKLSAARGNGTSMISLIIPPRDQISRVQKMLSDEFGTASNIKSRVTRQSVLSAITSTQQKLKNYTRVPPNGLVVYCGMITTGARACRACRQRNGGFHHLLLRLSLPVSPCFVDCRPPAHAAARCL